MPYYVDPAAPERGGLAVQIGAWLVVVPDLDDPANHPDDHLTPDQLAVWAQNVGGWVDDDGFLVVASTGRALTLDQSAKGAFVLGPTSSHSGGVSSRRAVAVRGTGDRHHHSPPVPEDTSGREPGRRHGAIARPVCTSPFSGHSGSSTAPSRASTSRRSAPHHGRRRSRSRVARSPPERPSPAWSWWSTTPAPPSRTEDAVGCSRSRVTKPGELPDLAWLGCLQQLTVPEGESSYPVDVPPQASGCSTGRSARCHPANTTRCSLRTGAISPRRRRSRYA